MLLKIHPDNPDERKMARVLDVLRSGGVIIYPTDTVYSLGCDVNNSKALARVAQIKGVKLEKHDFSLVCNDLSQISYLAKGFSTGIYKLMKKSLPGPFTFILPASTNVPRMFKHNKKTVGIRVPDHNVPRLLVEQLGSFLVATSIHDDDEVLEYTTDPELIHEKYEHLVDVVIDSGYGNNIPSTVVDCTEDEPQIVRQGAGELEI